MSLILIFLSLSAAIRVGATGLPTAVGVPQKYHYYVGFKDAFAGHLKPERTEPSLLFRNVGETALSM